MRNILSVVSLFLLAGCITGSDGYKYGDLVRFGVGHYAVALGEGQFIHQTYDGCKIDSFNELKKTVEHRLDNYQDVAGKEPTSIDIKTHLNIKDESFENCCGKYIAKSNNCEHTATYIRYGKDGRTSCLASSYLHKTLLNSKCKNWKEWTEDQIEDEWVWSARL
ncbi:hypothetical protein AALO_G00171000 [Alosa alosa]|uniref:LRAT domain-containing protein n=1 Tax=Alosa alosa TaxID=278164 RepID=A0AAV6GCT7_9TELE|nr:hypothetical protein AALO_G00171000 [Alosa alosa]